MLRTGILVAALLLAGSLPASPATFLVNSTDDGSDVNAGDGQCWTGGIIVIGMFGVNECTLRAALEEADALAGADVIGFSSLLEQSGGFSTIIPASALPTSFDTVEIDGTTAAGYDTADPEAVPVVQIYGVSVPGDGLKFGGGASGSAVRALAVFGFGADAINMGHDDSVIEGCHIGLAQDSVVLGNGDDGILALGRRIVVGQSCGLGVGCSGRPNVVVGSSGSGIVVGSDDVVVAGNRVGTNPAGTATTIGAFQTGNQGVGVHVSLGGRDSFIGALGSVPAPPGPDVPVASGNVISGNGGGGILIETVNVSVFANRIGTDVTGTATLGFQGDGIRIESDAATIGDLGIGGNVIAGNVDGIAVGQTVDASVNLIQGNWIGVDATGTIALGNSSDGIDLDRGVFNVVADNVIGGSGIHGVRASAFDTMVVDNFVGTNAAGDDLGNGFDGVRVLGDENLVSGNTVGFGFRGISIANLAENFEVSSNFVGTDGVGRDLGNTNVGVAVELSTTGVVGGDVGTPDGSLPARANEIAFNGQGGVTLAGTAMVAIRGNSIHDNTNLGIDLGADGPTPNDAGDGDDGANRLQNHPQLDASQTVYTPQTKTLSVRYRVDSTPGSNATYPLRVDFYLDDGAGEGETWVGSDLYAAGEASTYVVAAFIPSAGDAVEGSLLLATATDSSGAGATSEFGAPVAVPEPHALVALLAGVAALPALARARRRAR